MPNHFPWYLKSHGIQVKSQEIKKKDNIEAIFRKCKKKDPTNYQLVSRSSVLRKIMEQILLGTTLRHMENRDVISDSWHSFTKGKSCLTNLVSLCGQVTTTMDKKSAKDVIYHNFCKAFNLVYNFYNYKYNYNYNFSLNYKHMDSLCMVHISLMQEE